MRGKCREACPERKLILLCVEKGRNCRLQSDFAYPAGTKLRANGRHKSTSEVRMNVRFGALRGTRFKCCEWQLIGPTISESRRGRVQSLQLEGHQNSLCLFNCTSRRLRFIAPFHCRNACNGDSREVSGL